MTENGEIRKGSILGDSRVERACGDLAENTVTRRHMLRLLGGAIAGAALTSISVAGCTGAPQVNIIDDLRALSGSSLGGPVEVLGYYAPDDGGGGLFYSDSTDTTSTDNGGTIIAPKDGGPRWKRAETKEINIEVFGVESSQTAATNRARLLEANASHPEAIFYFSRGDYLIDNSGDQIILWNISGGLIFTGNSRIVYTANQSPGITMQNSKPGAIVEGIRTYYQTAPITRKDSASALGFASCDRIVIRRPYVDRSPGSGIHISGCTGPQLLDATVMNTLADGTQFQNSGEFYVKDYSSEVTGDDGLAFVNQTTAGADPVDGGVAQGISCKKSDTQGISVAGHHDIVISNFLVEDTNSAGIYVSADPAYNLRTPYNVKFENGRIKNPGAYRLNAPYYNSGNGIRVYTLPSETPTVDEDFTFDNIDVINPREQGILSEANTGTQSFSRIRVEGGAQTTGDLAGTFAATGANISASYCEVSNVSGMGFSFYDAMLLTLLNLVAYNTSQAYTGNRAFSIEARSKNMIVTGQHLQIVDDQEMPTGYVFYSWAQTGYTITGDLGNVRYSVTQPTSAQPWQVTGGSSVTGKLVS